MGNVFDQFDEQAAPPPIPGNVFDQFDDAEDLAQPGAPPINMGLSLGDDATAMTRPDEPQPEPMGVGESGLEGLSNTFRAVAQGTSPHPLDRSGKDIPPLGMISAEGDGGEMYWKDQSGKEWPVNPQRHVVLQKQGQLVVYPRLAENDEGVLSQGARLMMPGMMTGPVAGPAKSMQPMAIAKARSLGFDAPQATVAQPAKAALQLQRAENAAGDLQSFDDLGVRPFGPAFGSGPMAGIGKQLSETWAVGAPLKDALDESISGARSAAENIASGFGNTVTREQAGKVVREGIERFKDARPSEIVERTAQAYTPEQRKAILAAPARTTSLKTKQAALYEDAWADIPTFAKSEVPLQMKTGRAEKDLPRVHGDMPETRSILDEITNRNLKMLNLSRVKRDEAALAPGDFHLTRQGGIPNVALPIRGGILGEAVKAVLDGNWKGGLQTMRDIRSDFRRLSSGMADTERNVMKLSDIDRVESAITRDMVALLERNALEYRNIGKVQTTNGVEVNGNEVADNMMRASRKLTRADAFTRRSMKRMEIIESLFDANDYDSIYRGVLQAAKKEGGNTAKLTTLARTLRGPEMDEIRSAVMRQMGSPTAGARGTAEEVGFSVARATTEWNKLSDEAKNVLFPGHHRQTVDKFFRVAKRLANVEALANTSRTGTNTTNVGSLLAGAAAVVSGSVDVVTGGLATAGSMYGISYLLSRPTYARWAVKYAELRALQKRVPMAGRQMTVIHLNKLKNLAANDNSLRPIYQNLAAENGIIQRPEDQEEPNN